MQKPLTAISKYFRSKMAKIHPKKDAISISDPTAIIK